MLPPRLRNKGEWVANFQCGVGWALSFAFAIGVGCSDDSAPKGGSPSLPSPPPPQAASAPPPLPEPPAESHGQNPATESRSEAELIKAGRGVYNGNCIACHNMDPTRDGALGPSLAGSSLDLLEARVLRNAYPEGYLPKRDTRVMIALPHLEPRLGDLAAYLGSF